MFLHFNEIWNVLNAFRYLKSRQKYLWLQGFWKFRATKLLVIFFIIWYGMYRTIDCGRKRTKSVFTYYHYIPKLKCRYPYIILVEIKTEPSTFILSLICNLSALRKGWMFGKNSVQVTYMSIKYFNFPYSLTAIALL